MTPEEIEWYNSAYRATRRRLIEEAATQDARRAFNREQVEAFRKALRESTA